MLFGIWHCYDVQCIAFLCVYWGIWRVDDHVLIVLFGHRVQFGFGCVVGNNRFSCDCLCIERSGILMYVLFPHPVCLVLS